MRRNIFQITALLFMGCLLANTVSSASTGLVPGLHLSKTKIIQEEYNVGVKVIRLRSDLKTSIFPTPQPLKLQVWV